jgi:hypothetical protein
LTIDEIIERTHQRTQRLAENSGLDMRALYLDCLQELCAENRWPWRRKWTSFTTTSGTATYDLSDSAGANAGDLEEIESVKLINSATDTPDITVVTDPDTMISIQESTDTGDPASYFLEPGSSQTIHLYPTPDGTKTIRITYWAIPNPAADNTDTSIPLLPAIDHRVLLKRMCAEVWSLLPGEGIESPNYVKVMQQYEKGLELMLAKYNFSTRAQRRWVSNDAIRSTC